MPVLSHLSTVLISLGVLAAAAYGAWAALGEGVVPLGDAARIVRAAGVVVLVLGFVARSLFGQPPPERPGAVDVSGRIPSKGIDFRSALVTLLILALLGGFAASFAFDEEIEWRAAVEKNARNRNDGIRRFFERRPTSTRLDDALVYVLAEPDYVKAATMLPGPLLDAQRDRVVGRLLERISREDLDRATDAIVELTTAFPERRHTDAARRIYVERIARPLLAKGDGKLSDGARALLMMLCEAVAREEPADLSVVALPPAGQEDEVSEVVRALSAALRERVPFEVGRDPKAQRRLELRWRARGGRLVVIAKLVGVVADTPFEGEYETALAPGAGRVIADALERELLP